MKQRVEFSEPNSMTKYCNTSLVFFKKSRVLGVPRVKGVGVVILFHMKELQLELHKYMKMKLSLSVLFFPYQ